jgi:hypothetical protein
MTIAAAATRIEHLTVAGGQNLQCLWPGLGGGLWQWGDELLAAFVESPCAYRHPQEAARDLNGTWKRGYVRLRRSLDGGATWADDGKAFDNSLSFEKHRHFLGLDEYRGNAARPHEPIDPTSDNTLLLMGRAWCGDEIPGTRIRNSVTYCIRSADRGRRWEASPEVVPPHHAAQLIPCANNTLRCADGTLVAWLGAANGSECTGHPVAYLGPALYRSEDGGATWTFLSEIAFDPARHIAYASPRLLPLASGRWLCFMNGWFASAATPLHWTALCWSDDLGLNWSAPRRIAPWAWSPYPLLLSDGRIALLSMRCAPDPAGLFCLVSNDEGGSWSRPIQLREAALLAGQRGALDLGYPVAVERGPGRILVLYDWQNRDEDVPWYGGRSYIAGSHFELL